MEREALLATLTLLLGGLALQLFAAWPQGDTTGTASRQRERMQWLLLWWPVAAALTVAAWLCGWALSQPDPVPHPVGRPIFIAVLPFVLVGVRALARAGWSAWQAPRHCAIATVGLLRPRIVIAPQLETVLDAAALQAALAHERAHLRHLDPLRIWLAQFVTDLQWPSASAQRRFDLWLAALETARDDEARATGVDGADLAAAVLGSVRFQLGSQSARVSPARATLIGRAEELPARIARLLEPLPATKSGQDEVPYWRIAAGLAILWCFAVALGTVSGERLIDALLALSA